MQSVGFNWGFAKGLRGLSENNTEYWQIFAIRSWICGRGGTPVFQERDPIYNTSTNDHVMQANNEI